MCSENPEKTSNFYLRLIPSLRASHTKRKDFPSTEWVHQDWEWGLLSLSPPSVFQCFLFVCFRFWHSRKSLSNHQLNSSQSSRDRCEYTWQGIDFAKIAWKVSKHTEYFSLQQINKQTLEKGENLISRIVTLKWLNAQFLTNTYEGYKKKQEIMAHWSHKINGQKLFPVKLTMDLLDKDYNNSLKYAQSTKGTHGLIMQGDL